MTLKIPLALTNDSSARVRAGFPTQRLGFKPYRLTMLQRAIPAYWIVSRSRRILLFVAGDSLDRAVIEGDLVDDIKQFTINQQARLKGNNVVENSYRPEFNEAFFAQYPELKPFESTQLLRPYGNYVEGLYFGRLPPKKIKAMVYHGRPPSEEEMRILRERGIEVID